MKFSLKNLMFICQPVDRVIYLRNTLRKIKPTPYISKIIMRVCLHFRLEADFRIMHHGS